MAHDPKKGFPEPTIQPQEFSKKIKGIPKSKQAEVLLSVSRSLSLSA